MPAGCCTPTDVLGQCNYIRSPCRIWPLFIQGQLAAGAAAAAIGPAAGVAPQYPFVGELMQGTAYGPAAGAGEVPEEIELTQIMVGTRHQSAIVGVVSLAIFRAENQLNPMNFDPTQPGVGFFLLGNNLDAVNARAVSIVVFGRMLGTPPG